MKKVIKIIFLLKLFLVLLSPLKSEEITENTFIIKKVEELGEFIEPKNYPLGMQNLFIAGCNGFSCTADNLAKEMIIAFNRKGVYLEKYPGTQLHAMAMYEVFYQKKLKDNEDKIKEFITHKKNKKDIASLIKLNEARKKMRSSLGMDLKLSTEQVIENYWIMGDFLNQGETKKNKVNKEIKKRKKIIKKYISIVSNLKTSISKEKEKKFYDKLIKKKINLELNLKKDPYTKFKDDYTKLKKTAASLPEGKIAQAKNFDKAIVEINNLTDFILLNSQKNNQLLNNVGLDVLKNKLTSISNKLSKEYSNDLSKVDINKISKNASTVMSEITQNIKDKREKDINNLLSDMAEINNQGLNIFKLNRNLKQLGFETVKFEDVSKFADTKFVTVKEPSDNLVKLLQNRVSLIEESMSKLGYSTNEINKEIEIIKSTGINSELSQNILTARHMMISGAGDKEIQDEINLWSSINISNLQNDAYLVALNARSRGIPAKNVKSKIQITNAVETYRKIDKLLGQVEKQIDRSNLATLAPDDNDLDQNAFVFAQVGGSGYTNNFFSDGSRNMFYDKFLEEQKNKQIEVFQKKFTAGEIYQEINTPLTVVSLIVSPSPLNVIKLAKIAKEQADEKKARVLAAASFGTGEDELGAGDYVDPRIFERTMKVLNSIQVKDIQSKNLAKKLNYSISLISLEAATNEIADQSNDAVSEVIKENKKDLDNIPKEICVNEDCFVISPPVRPTPINPIMPIDVFIKKAEKVKKVELIKNFQTMVQDKSISNLEISNRTLSNSKVIDMQLYFEELGILDAANKVSEAYAAVGLSNDGIPSIDAIMDPSFDIAAHLDAMDTVASEAGLQADIASASQAAADVQDAINSAAGEISEELAQANAEAQQALADAQRALDESRADPNADGEGEECGNGGRTC